MTLENKIYKLLKPYFEETQRVCIECGHTEGNHYWGAQLEQCAAVNCACSSPKFKDKVVGDGITPDLVGQIIEIVEEKYEKNNQ